jgi:hypothetical protein
MAAQLQTQIQHVFREGLRIHITSPFRPLLLGGSLAFAIQQEKYWHIPILTLFPGIYTGYHSFIYLQRESEKKPSMKNGTNTSLVIP